MPEARSRAPRIDPLAAYKALAEFPKAWTGITISEAVRLAKNEPTKYPKMAAITRLLGRHRVRSIEVALTKFRDRYECDIPCLEIEFRQVAYVRKLRKNPSRHVPTRTPDRMRSTLYAHWIILRPKEKLIPPGEE